MILTFKVKHGRDFNIALRSPDFKLESIYQSSADRDALEGSTNAPKEEML